MISNKLIYIILDYHCDICDKKLELESKNKHFKSFRHNDYGKCIQVNYTFQNPSFFDLVKIYNDYISNHNRKFKKILLKLILN